MGFLDNAGLSRLWGKVTARRRVLTAEEYAALTDEEKNADVVYMVPEEGGSGGGSEVSGSNSGSGVFWMDFEFPDGISTDSGAYCKTDFQEVVAAVAQGQLVMARVTADHLTYFAPLTFVVGNVGVEFSIFDLDSKSIYSIQYLDGYGIMLEITKLPT